MSSHNIFNCTYNSKMVIIFNYQTLYSFSYFYIIEILDYRVNNSPLQFVEAAGNQTQCAYVQPINDGIDEPTEYFTFLLSSEERSVIVTNPTAIIIIQDKDLCP